MRQALARVDLAAVVSIFRAATGLSQAELGNLVEGWSQSLVCLIEQGKRDVVYDIRRLLAFTDTVGMPRPALLPLILGDPDAILEGEDTVALQEAGTVDIDRRLFNTLAAGFAAAAVLPPARVDRAHVRYLQAGLAQLRTQDGLVGGGALLPESLRQFTQARAMLDESDYTEAVGRELLIVAADLGLQSAWFAFDTNDQPLARRLYEDAALLADNAEDSQLRGHMYANMAQQCTHLALHTGRQGFAREALRFADRAADAARHEPSPALHSLISMRRSLAHAHLGDEAAFRSARRSPCTRRRARRGSVRPARP